MGHGPSWCHLPLWAGPFAKYRGQAVDQEELSKTATQPTCIESCRPVLRGLALPGIVTGAHSGLLWGTQAQASVPRPLVECVPEQGCNQCGSTRADSTLGLAARMPSGPAPEGSGEPGLCPDLPVGTSDWASPGGTAAPSFTRCPLQPLGYFAHSPSHFCFPNVCSGPGPAHPYPALHGAPSLPDPMSAE